jgi:hypothetical protein
MPVLFIFSTSISALLFLLLAPGPKLKFFGIVFSLLILALAYLASPTSPSSPFSPVSGLPFGLTNSQQIVLILSALIGMIAGAIASPLLAGRKRDRRAALQAFLAAPITVLPVIQSLQKEVDPTYFSYLIAALLAYQSAAFWEQTLNKITKKQD